MKKPTHFRPGSDELDDLTRGHVDVARINDVMARPDSKRFKEYLTLIQDQFLGEKNIDHDDQYREQAKELLPNALHYEKRNGVKTVRGLLFYYYDPDFKIAACPDAVDYGEADEEGNYKEPIIGLTVHIRQTRETYDASVERGIDKPMERHAQAMMKITGLPNWIHLDYWEDANLRLRRLFEHPIKLDERHAAALEEALIGFVYKSRLRAAARVNWIYSLIASRTPLRSGTNCRIVCEKPAMNFAKLSIAAMPVSTLLRKN